MVIKYETDKYKLSDRLVYWCNSIDNGTNMLETLRNIDYIENSKDDNYKLERLVDE